MKDEIQTVATKNGYLTKYEVKRIQLDVYDINTPFSVTVVLQ
jgi:hypothetical protein